MTWSRSTAVRRPPDIWPSRSVSAHADVRRAASCRALLEASRSSPVAGTLGVLGYGNDGDGDEQCNLPALDGQWRHTQVAAGNGRKVLWSSVGPAGLVEHQGHSAGLAGDSTLAQALSHALLVTGSVTWCRVCGAYADARVRGLRGRCSGPPLRRGGSGRTSIRRLMAGCHPLSGEHMGAKTMSLRATAWPLASPGGVDLAV